MARRSTLFITAALTVVVLGTAGCLQDPDASSGAGGEGVGGFVDGGSPDDDGVVELLGAFGGSEADAFNKTIAEFEDESGIDIQYVADSDFTTTIQQRVGANDAPDIGLFPQPGGVLDLAADDKIQPIDTFLDYDALDRTLIEGFLDAGRYNGRVYGAPMRLTVKSLVWYPKPAYEDAGYSTEPATMSELTGIADKIKAGGTPPWCIGWQADQATGWVGTDWIEEYMLRLHGPKVYDQWTSHEIPFNDPRVVEAFDAFGKLVKGKGNVLGGADGVLNTPFEDAMTPAFKDPPGCYLERQANFISGFFPSNVQKNLDDRVGIYVFPPIEGGFQGQPILGGGDLAALFNGNDDESKEVMKFLTSDKFGDKWAQAGGWLSPHTSFDMDNYPDQTTKDIATIAVEADVFRYDGSDLMPNAVGGGSFWSGMVQWMGGEKTSKQVTDDIEASWPSE
jgi:alpha-glucoside transport system substrate-binding protein